MNKLRTPLLKYLLALLSAILLILTFPKYDFAGLAAIALAPLLIALANEPRPRQRFLLGYITGVVYWFGICNWIQFVLEYHGGMGRWGGWAVFLLFCFAKALHMGFFALFAAVLLRHWYAIPAIAALWTGIERTHVNLGFVWLPLGNAALDMQLPLRLAPMTGVYGMSFVFALTATAAAVAVTRRHARRELAWLALLGVLFTLPAVPHSSAPAERATVVQPNLPEDETAWTPYTADRMHQHLLSMSLKGALKDNTSLIIWPEAPAPIYYTRDSALQTEAAELTRATHAWFLLGTVAFTPANEPLNSAVLLNPYGQPVERYDKMNLVPFGEFVPKFFGFVNRITQEAGDFVPGSRMVLLPMGSHRLGTFICYESAFPNQVREFAKLGADLLVNISNDGYFGHSAAREQHLKLVRMRAVENRRWIVRATNDGITATIDPGGRVVQRLPMYTETAAATSFSYVSATTPYTRYGDWFAWGCLLASIVALVASQWPHYSPPAPSIKSAG